MKHQPNLDILRAFAVGVVLLGHTIGLLALFAGLHNPTLIAFTFEIGHAGVLAFFVHTSLVLMYSLERMRGSVNHVTLRFYVRRFFRIYPLAIFSILLILIFHIPEVLTNTPISTSKLTIITNLLLIQNLVGKQQIMAPLWSLPYEVQMYIVLPALFLIASKKKGPVYLAALFVFFCAVGIALALTTGHLNMATYIPCFLSGVLCYSLRNRILPRINWMLWPLFLTCMICLYCLSNMHREASFWSGWIFCLVLGLAINCFHDSKSRPLNFAVNKVATYSYGMYLLNMPVLYLIFYRWHVSSIVLGSVLSVVLTFGAAVIAFHCVELPFMDLGRRLSSPRRKKAYAEPISLEPAP